MSGFKRLPMMLFRAGTSRGPLFLKSALPASAAQRDEVLLGLMGSSPAQTSDRPAAPSPLQAGLLPPPGASLLPRAAQALGVPQVDGLGGGQTVTSKVLVVNESSHPGVDVDYLVCEVDPRHPRVETSIDCGNMVAAVAPFAIAQGLTTETPPHTTVRIRSENTGALVEATLPAPIDAPAQGDGQPRTGTPVMVSFLDPGGTTCGTQLPTGAPTDWLEGTPVSCVDISMPMVIVEAAVLGKTGYESKVELDADKVLMGRLESLRQGAAARMRLGNVENKVMPKICMVAPPRWGGDITARYMVAPFNCDTHATMAITGALCLGGSALIEGTVAHGLVEPAGPHGVRTLFIEHPAGRLPVRIESHRTPERLLRITRASYARTARLLAEGVVYPL